jgi:2-polyprenyl-3-methyl-5-hydroxy-6-metoxy-1,4-benzoquinol methylase
MMSHGNVALDCSACGVVLKVSRVSGEELWPSFVQSEGRCVARGKIELTRQLSVGGSSGRQLLGDRQSEEGFKKVGNKGSYYQYDRREVGSLLPSCYSKVLEIGCGEGRFASNMTHRCEYWGIEPVQSVAEVASQRLQRVLTGTYEGVYDQLPDTYFDLIICNDVIEHMFSHEEFFRSIKRKMENNAYLVGSVPNVRHIENLYWLLIKKDWMYRDEGILDRRHLRFFTERSLKRTIIENDFEIERFQGINSVMRKWPSIGRGVANVFIYFINLCSFGFYGDIRFLQFAFRIKLSSACVGTATDRAV